MNCSERAREDQLREDTLAIANETAEWDRLSEEALAEFEKQLDIDFI